MATPLKTLVSFERNKMGKVLAEGDVHFRMYYYLHTNVKAGKIEIVSANSGTCNPSPQNFSVADIERKIKDAGAAPCPNTTPCRPTTYNTKGHGQQHYGCPSILLNSTSQIYKLEDGKNIVNFEVNISNLEYCIGCGGSTVMTIVLESVSGGSSVAVLDLTGWDIQNKAVQVSTSTEDYYWYPLVNCPNASESGTWAPGAVEQWDPMPQTDSSKRQACWSRKITEYGGTPGETWWVFAGPKGGLGVTNPGCVKVNTNQDTGIDSDKHLGCLKAPNSHDGCGADCHACYTVDLSQPVLAVAKDSSGNIVSVDDPCASSAGGSTEEVLHEYDSTDGSWTLKGRKIFNREGTCTTDRFAQLYSTGGKAACDSCIAGNARECSKNIMRALFACGWGKGATIRVKDVTLEEGPGGDGYKGDGDRSVVTMRSSSYALNALQTFNFKNPGPSGGEDSHLGLQHRRGEQVFSPLVFGWNDSAQDFFRDTDGKPKPQGSAAFHAGDMFGEIMMQNQYGVNIAEKQIADLIWDTLDPNDPRILSGTIRQGGHVFEQMYQTNVALRMGINLNRYTHASWSVDGNIAERGGSTGVMESSKTFSLSSKMGITIDNLGLMCDDLAILFSGTTATRTKMKNAFGKRGPNTPHTGRGEDVDGNDPDIKKRGTDSYGNQHSEINRIIRNSLSIDFVMGGASSSESWSWKPSYGGDADGTDDGSGRATRDFNARLKYASTRNGWGEGGASDLMKMLVVPKNVIFTHDLAISNGISATSKYNLGAGTFDSDIALFDGQLYDLLHPSNGAVKAEDHPQLGRIKAGIRFSLADNGTGSPIEIEIPLTYSKSFAAGKGLASASMRIDAGISAKMSNGGFEMVPSASISGDFMKYFKYDFDVITNKGSLKVLTSQGRAFANVNEWFKDKQINAQLNWDIDLQYDFQTGKYRAQAGIQFEMMQELFSFAKMHSAFGRIMLEVHGGIYKSASNTNSSEGFDTSGSMIFAGVAGRLIYQNNILSWLGFPIDIHPHIGFGASMSFTFSEAKTTLADHTSFQSNNSGTPIDNQTKGALGWGAFMGAFGWTWKMADSLRQQLYMRHDNFFNYIPILGAFLGPLASKIPVAKRIGAREPVITYLIRAQFMRSFLAFNAAGMRCHMSRNDEITRLGKIFLKNYLKAADPPTAIPYISPARDVEWEKAMNKPDSTNLPIRRARAIIYYLARGLGYFTFESPHCKQRVKELDAVRNMAFPGGDKTVAMRMEPVPGMLCKDLGVVGGIANMEDCDQSICRDALKLGVTLNKCIYRCFHALDPFAQPAYISAKNTGTYRTYGFFSGYEMLKAFRNVPEQFQGWAGLIEGDDTHPDGEMYPSDINKSLLTQYIEYIKANPKCDCLAKHYWSAQRDSEYYNVFAINGLQVGDVKDAFTRLGRHSQDTIIDTVMDEVAKQCWKALENLDIKEDIDFKDVEAESFADSIKPETMKRILMEIYTALVDQMSSGGHYGSSRYWYANKRRHKNIDKVERRAIEWAEDEIRGPGTKRHLAWADNSDESKYKDKKDFAEQVYNAMTDDGNKCPDNWKKLFCYMGQYLGAAFSWITEQPFKVIMKYNPLQWVMGLLKSSTNKFKVDRDYLVDYKGNRRKQSLKLGQDSAMRGVKGAAGGGYTEDMPIRVCDDPELVPVDGLTPATIRNSNCIQVVQTWSSQWFKNLESLYDSMRQPTSPLPIELKRAPMRSFFLMDGITTPDQYGFSDKEGVPTIKDEDNPSHGQCLLTIGRKASRTNKYYKKYSFYYYNLLKHSQTVGITACVPRLKNDLISLGIGTLQQDIKSLGSAQQGVADPDGVSDTCGLCLLKDYSVPGVVGAVGTLDHHKTGLQAAGYLHQGEGWWDHNKDTPDRKSVTRAWNGAYPVPSGEEGVYYTYTGVSWFDDIDSGDNLINQPVFNDQQTRDWHSCSYMWDAGLPIIGISDFISGNHFLITGDIWRYQRLEEHGCCVGPSCENAPKLLQCKEHISNFSPCLNWGSLETQPDAKEDAGDGTMLSVMGLMWLPKTDQDLNGWGATSQRYEGDSIPGTVGDIYSANNNDAYIHQQAFDDELHKKVFSTPVPGGFTLDYSFSDMYEQFLVPMWHILKVGEYAGPPADWEGRTGNDLKHVAPSSLEYQEARFKWDGEYLSSPVDLGVQIPHGFNYDSGGPPTTSVPNAEIFYGLKRLMTILSGSPNLSSIPHINEMHLEGLRALKAQAKLIEMTWRAAMLVSLSRTIINNGEYNCPWRAGLRQFKKFHGYVNVMSWPALPHSSAKPKAGTMYGYDGGCLFWGPNSSQPTLTRTNLLEDRWDKMPNDLKDILRNYPLEYLHKTYNMGGGVARNRDERVHRSQVWKDFLENSKGIIKYDVTRFAGEFYGGTTTTLGQLGSGHFQGQGGAAETYWNSTWGPQVGGNSVFFRAFCLHWGQKLGTDSHMRGGIRIITEENDPRALCDLPYNYHWKSTNANRAQFGDVWKGVNNISSMIEKLAGPISKNSPSREAVGYCEDCPRFVEMLNRPPWRRDGWVKDPKNVGVGRNGTRAYGRLF